MEQTTARERQGRGCPTMYRLEQDSERRVLVRWTQVQALAESAEWVRSFRQTELLGQDLARVCPPVFWLVRGSARRAQERLKLA